jgi:dienelactone hydrolase
LCHRDGLEILFSPLGTTNSMIRAFLLVALAAAGCRPSSVVEAPLGASAPTPVESGPSSAAPPVWWPPTTDLVAFPSGELTLHGYLYRPLGTGPFPAVVFNHGSEQLPGPYADEAEFYVRHGFVLFVPHRRGQGRSADAGPYIGDTIKKSGMNGAVFVHELEAQSDDVMAAAAYVGALPYVDSKRVAVAGCSFGGIESLLAAERGTGIYAAVDFAGGAMSWAYPELRQRMTQAAHNAKVPVFFVQAKNDFDTTPSMILSGEMRRAGHLTRIHVFPAHGTTHEDGHSFCRGGANPAWGDEVLAFLAAPSAP